MNNDPNNHDRLLKIGLIVAGIASVGGLAAMVLIAIEKVSSGHGLDTYRTTWLVEFNWVGFLVLLAATVVAVIFGLWLRYRERREEKQLQAKYAKENHDG